MPISWSTLETDDCKYALRLISAWVSFSNGNPGVGVQMIRITRPRGRRK
jgi:hypothetical protein